MLCFRCVLLLRFADSGREIPTVDSKSGIGKDKENHEAENKPFARSEIAPHQVLE
jgi:hypothetical protein